MNNKPSPKKILVNGCSNTAAVIPDLQEFDWKEYCWPTLLSKKLNCEVVNLALPGKANVQIIEETLRYLFNHSDVDHVVVQLTEWERFTNVYRYEKSFSIIPGDMDSQFGEHSDKFTSPYRMITGGHKILNNKGIVIKHGDESLVYETLAIFTLLNCLYSYCVQNNIGLTLFNFDFIEPYILEDKLVQNIPKDVYLQSDITVGLFQYLNIYYNNDGGHFHKPSHVELSNRIADHIENGNQIIIRKELIKPQEKIIYDYTT